MASFSERPPAAPLAGLGRRLVDGLVTAWAAVSLTFFALRLSTGDPVAALLSQGLTTAAQAAEVRQRLGYDLPVLQQYVHFLSGLLRGDLGVSIYSGQPVSRVLRAALPSTLQLAAASLLIALPLGAMLGGAAGWSRSRAVKRVAGGLASLTIALPVAGTGVAALWLTAQLGGRAGLWLPAAVLGCALAGPFARAVQAGLLTTRRSAFITAARARGLRENSRLIWHAIRPSLPAILSLLAVEVAFLFAGTVVTESIFSRPGLGRALVRAILQADYPIAQAIVGLSAVVYVATQVVADGLGQAADPRLRKTG